MMAKPVKTLELHYAMIEILIMTVVKVMIAQYLVTVLHSKW